MCRLDVCKVTYIIDDCDVMMLETVRVVGNETNEKKLKKSLSAYCSDTQICGREAAVFELECKDLYEIVRNSGWKKYREPNLYVRKLYVDTVIKNAKKAANDPLANEEKVFSDIRGQEKEMGIG